MLSIIIFPSTNVKLNAKLKVFFVCLQTLAILNGNQKVSLSFTTLVINDMYLRQNERMWILDGTKEISGNFKKEEGGYLLLKCMTSVKRRDFKVIFNSTWQR